MALLFISTLFSGVAQTFEADGIWYKIMEAGKCMVSSNPASEYSGILAVPETVANEGTFYEVTGVADFAFDGCKNLESVSLPQTVKSIGRNAFYECTSLVGVESSGIESIGNAAFAGCQALAAFEFSNSIRSIGDNAFRYCSALEVAYLPEEAVLGEAVFTGCRQLREVSLPELLTELPPYLFSECVSLENLTGTENLKTIGDYSFANCSSLENIEFGEELSLIGSHAFSMCRLLKLKEISGQDLTIAGYAFEGCEALTELTFRGVYEIGEEAFGNCRGLTSVDFGNSLKFIRDRAFRAGEDISYVACYSEQPPFLSSSAFPVYVYMNATLEVLPGKSMLYTQTPPWSNFLKIIPEEEYDGVEAMTQENALDFHIFTKGLDITVCGPRGQIYVFTPSGLKMAEVEKSDADFTLLMPRKGLYIMVVNGVSFKVAL